MICPRCGFVNEETAQTCQNCEYPFSHYHNFGDFARRGFPVIPIISKSENNRIFNIVITLVISALVIAMLIMGLKALFG